MKRLPPASPAWPFPKFYPRPIPGSAPSGRPGSTTASPGADAPTSTRARYRRTPSGRRRSRGRGHVFRRCRGATRSSSATRGSDGLQNGGSVANGLWLRRRHLPSSPSSDSKCSVSTRRPAVIRGADRRHRRSGTGRLPSDGRQKSASNSRWSTDGKRVYVILRLARRPFGHDLDGKLIWQKDLEA